MEDDVIKSGTELEDEVVEDEVVEEKPEPILGKFNSSDELATAYTELEKKMGEQGNELGTQKQMNAALLEQMQQRQAVDQIPASEVEKDDFDYDTRMSELAKGVEEGDIPIEKALVDASNLAAENATRKALSQYEQMSERKQQQAAQEKFLADHPDFRQLQRTGELAKIKQTLPGMHDDFSAYFAFQADQLMVKAQAKAEEDRIASGDERNNKILNKPGAKAKEIGKPKKGLSKSELKAHTLARLNAMDE
ncbi:MAG: hypothetical protein U9N73_01760 [Candidatus Auribacterota bacterium]|nr:hypothetical protein [Candidatus Auribacterota bacterium]